MAGKLLTDMEAVLAETKTLLSSTSSGKLMDSYSSLTAKIKAMSYLPKDGVGILIKVIRLLVDSDKGFILLSQLKSEIVAFLSAINRNLRSKDDIPTDVRPMVDTLEEYLAKMKQLTNKTENDIAELIEVVFHDFVLKVIINR